MSFKCFHTTYICYYSSNFVHAPQAIMHSKTSKHIQSQITSINLFLSNYVKCLFNKYLSYVKGCTILGNVIERHWRLQIYGLVASYFTLKLQTHQLSNFKEIESLQLLKTGSLLCATQTWYKDHRKLGPPSWSCTTWLYNWWLINLQRIHPAQIMGCHLPTM
jgi:hypothetical protein